jgi:hypothetical protein
MEKRNCSHLTVSCLSLIPGTNKDSVLLTSIKAAFKHQSHMHRGKPKENSKHINLGVVFRINFHFSIIFYVIKTFLRKIVLWGFVVIAVLILPTLQNLG